MTTRTPAIFAVLTVLTLAADNEVYAQPVVPNRPPASAFGALFFPGTAVTPNAGTNLYGLNRLGANGGFGPNSALAPGFGSQNVYGPFAPYVLSMQPVVFNSRGHWFSNYYSHWYPNGLTNGTGVLSNGGTASSARLGGYPLLGGSTFGVPGSTLPGGMGMPGGIGMPGGNGLPAAGAVPIINR